MLTGEAGSEKVPTSPWLVTLLHICGVIPTLQSLISPETPHRYLRKLRTSADVAALSDDVAAPMSHRMASVSWCFTSCFHDVSQCFTSVSWCFTIFNNVLWCLVSRATIIIATSAAADHLRDRENATGIGDNSAEIGNDATGIIDIAAKVIPC